MCNQLQSPGHLDLHLVTDTDIAVADIQLVPPHSKQSYQINIVLAANQSINIYMTNTRLERVHFQMDNSQMSLHAHSCVFNQAGISIESEINQSHRSVRIERCTFHGDISDTSDTTIKLIKTTNVSIATSVFEDLRVAGVWGVRAVYCGNSEIEIDDTVFTRTSLTGRYAGTIRADRCNLTVTNLTMIDNQADDGDVWRYPALVSVRDSRLSISASRFEGNSVTEGDILSADSTQLHVEGCAFISNSLPASGRWRAVIFMSGNSHGAINNSRFENNKGDGRRVRCVAARRVVSVTVHNTVFTGQHIPDGWILDCMEGTMSLINVTLTHNAALFMQTGTCRVFVSSSTFTNNSAQYGGSSIYNTTLSISDSVFLYNTATDAQGCFALFPGSNVSITATNFSYNTASRGGVFYLSEPLVGLPAASLRVSFCSFHGNVAKQRGGVFASDGNHSITLSHCEFYGNSAASGGIGSTVGSHVRLSNCSITNNSAIKDGGVLFLTHHSTLLVDKNTVFDNNTCGTDGGAIRAYSNTTLNITNSYFIGNKASRGGVIFLENHCDMTMEDCIFSGNVAASGGGAIMVMGHSGYSDTGTSFNNNTASDASKL